MSGNVPWRFSRRGPTGYYVPSTRGGNYEPHIFTDNFNDNDGSNWLLTPGDPCTFFQNGKVEFKDTASVPYPAIFGDPHVVLVDQYAEMEFISERGSGSFRGKGGPAVRLADRPNRSGYFMTAVFTGGSPPWTMTLGSVADQTPFGTTQLDSDLWDLQPGDVLRLEAVGSLLRLLINGSLLFDYTDSTWTSGAVGFSWGAGAGAGTVASTWDNWRGGSLPRVIDPRAANEPRRGSGYWFPD